MASTVTNYSSKIDTGYPKAGQNNDSQGFRTNFSNIQNALSVAANEISTLQVNGVNLNKPTNDLGWASVLTRTQLQNSGLVAYSASSATNINNNIEIDFTQGSYQDVSVSTATSIFKVTNWAPTGVYGSLRLAVNSLVTGTISFNAGDGNILSVRDELPLTGYETTTTAVTVWDLWSADGGANVYVKFAGGPFV
jgi:hypothetical protein